jgi:carbon monoxide dehydrogenase subunit G
MREAPPAAAMPVLRLLATLLLGLLVLTSEAAGGEPKVVVTIDRNGDAFIIDAAFEVEVPPATAWGVLTDFDNMSSILTNLKSSRITSREGNTWMVKQAGAAKFGLFSFSFWSEREVRVEPMQRITVKGLAGSVKRMSSETRMEARGPGVQIRYHAEIVPDSILARLFGGSFVRHEIGEQFRLMALEMLRRESAAKAPERPAETPAAATPASGVRPAAD